ncbi:MFS transporter [Acidisoma cellulosilytica]|uniref:MFS transporter n=1 Tax=Acidisoma cellulosilyticum TaxID=2802395 RepID=A0A964E4A9_9PROT|nr:MFS transporter [Acidisoma cellulosilyticum]MCB8881102.1 MFS transporter [Acidisoma cellulosilyticum]
MDPSQIVKAREQFEPSGAMEARLTTVRQTGFLGVFGLAGVPRRAWLVTILSLGGWLLVNADGSLFNFTYPLIQKDLGLSDNDIALIYTLLYAVGAISTFFSGPMMDRIGRKPIYQACLFAAALGSVVTAAAPGFAVLLLGRAITQVGAATEWMSGQVMVAEEAPAPVRGRLIGIAQIGYPLGFFLGALMSLAIVDRWGWRVLFVCGLIPVLMMIWARRNVEDTKRFQEEVAIERQHTELRGSRISQLFEPDLRRSSIFISIWHFVYAFGAAGIISYLPTVYKHFGISLTGTFTSSAIATAIAAIGYVLAAFLGERFGRREICALFLVLGAGAGALLAFAATSWILLTIFYAGFYFFTLGHVTSAAGFATEVFPTRVRGTGCNLVGASEWFGFMVAAITGPWLLSHAGYSATLVMWCVAAPLIAAVCALCMKHVPPRTILEHVHR